MWGPQVAPVTSPCQRAEVTRQVRDPAHPSVPGPQHQEEFMQKAQAPKRSGWKGDVDRGACASLLWPGWQQGRLSRLPPV